MQIVSFDGVESITEDFDNAQDMRECAERLVDFVIEFRAKFNNNSEDKIIIGFPDNQYAYNEIHAFIDARQNFIWRP